ncbi:MAG TPA: DivIVA domain-containing protein [Intrasporangium sp.]|nr:DivIVA domain-containing protein [Intrasporangium sp.]
MKWFILLVGIVVLCFVVALMLGLGGGMGRPTSSLSHEPLPEGDLHDDDLAELRFDVTARGYRMSQVDGVVDRLRRELREKDEHIAFLRSGSVRTPAVTAADEPAAAEPAADGPAADGPAAGEPAADEPGVSDDEHERAQPHDSPKA